MKTSHYFSWLILGMMALSLYIILFQEDSKNPPNDTPSSMTGVAETPAFDAEKLQNYFSTLTEKKKFMGNIFLQKRDTPIFAGSFGFADAKSGQKLDANTRFRIGSISKTFVAVLVMQAVESGKISLSDPLSLFFPALKNAENISIEDMLRHQSGIFNYTASEGFVEWELSPRTHEEIFSLIDTGGSVFFPKTQTEYSNSNYYLLARILEAVHQKPYSEILKEGITEPLGLNNTAAAETIDPKKNEALSHVFVE